VKDVTSPKISETVHEILSGISHEALIQKWENAFLHLKRYMDAVDLSRKDSLIQNLKDLCEENKTEKIEQFLLDRMKPFFDMLKKREIRHRMTLF